MKRPNVILSTLSDILIKSTYETNKADNIFFYYKHEPHGEWWKRQKST